MARVAFAALPERFAFVFLAAGDRFAGAFLAADDFDRAELEVFAALLRFAVARFAVPRLAAGLGALLPAEAEAARAVAALAPSPAAHFPDITRCAASATASAISEPNFVALAIMLLAACDALSAASRPASRIARRAFGLALIAAAAAASPAASISLLIAPLASFSTVESPDRNAERDEDFDEVFRAGLAIAHLLPFRKQTPEAP